MEPTTMKLLLVIAGILACAVVPASAQSWGRGGAYAGAGGAAAAKATTRASERTRARGPSRQPARLGVTVSTMTARVLGTNWSSVSPTGDIRSGCTREGP